MDNIVKEAVDEAIHTAQEVVREAASSLPATVQGLIDQRKNKSKRTLNDQVDEIHLQLWADPSYRKLQDAVYSEQAVEGSLIADDFELARMIRVHAKKIGNPYVANQKLDTLRKSALVVARRYGISRKERREG